MKKYLKHIKINGANLITITKHKDDFILTSPSFRIPGTSEISVHYSFHTKNDRCTFKLTKCSFEGKTLASKELYNDIKGTCPFAYKTTPTDIDLFREVDPNKHINYENRLIYITSYAINFEGHSLNSFIGDSKSRNVEAKDFILPLEAKAFTLNLYIGKNCPEQDIDEIIVCYPDHTVLNNIIENNKYSFLFVIKYEFPEEVKQTGPSIDLNQYLQPLVPNHQNF